MTFLQIMLIIFSLFSLVCVYFALKAKSPNRSFIISASVLVVCNILVIILLKCDNAVEAKKLLTSYYAVFPWALVGAALIVQGMDTHSGKKYYYIPFLLIGLYQSIIMITNAFGVNVLTASLETYYGKTWWIAKPGDTGIFLVGMPFYRVLLGVASACMITLVIYISVRTAKLYRPTFYLFLGIQVILVSTNVVTGVLRQPVVISTVVLNLALFSYFFIIIFLNDILLKNWATMYFANEMSDGYILFDGHDDLLYMNDVIKRTLSPWLLATFSRKENVEEWMSVKEIIDGKEVLVYKENGVRRYFRAKKNEIIKNGYKIATIFMLHDATESVRQVKAMAKANMELERAAKMKSDFLANMSHEIRTPMNAVIGMVEIALREELPPAVEDCLIQIRHSGRSLLNIINDILDFSKIEAGKMSIVPEEYEPLSLFNDVANVLVTRIGDKNVRLLMEIDKNLPHTLVGDPARIRQVLINLANNAVKFTERGSVIITINCLPCGEDKLMLTVHIKDTGVGIKEDDLKKLFVSFQQLDSKRNRKVEGTGLGLVISKSLCEAMGGNIGVESTFGKGSDFWFSIPQRIAKPSKNIVVTKPETKRIVCFDDDGRTDGFFEREAEKFGVSFLNLRSLDEYRDEGKQDFMFYPESIHSDELVALIDSNEDITGIAVTAFGSDFKPAHKRIRVVQRPLTTLSVMFTLEGKGQNLLSLRNSEKTTIDFTAPTADILIVDDNDINITIAEGLMKPLKVRCRSALSGMEAIKITETETFDIILMDHMMPEMDGVETTYAIRNGNGPCKDKPIIALTANVMEDARAMFIKEGMNDLIAKPVDMRDLLAKLRQWLPPEKVIDNSSLGNIAENTEDSETPEDKPDFDFLDTEKALQSLGSVDLYKTIVSDYYKSGAKALEAIREAYDNEDWEDYTRRVHTLKSSSRQIGAYALGDDAEALEKAGKAGDIGFIKDHADALVLSYRDLLDRLSEHFKPEEEAQDLEEMTEEVLSGLFSELKEACDELDMDKMEQVEEKLKAYSYDKALLPAMEQLYEAIENVDTESCIQLMETIKDF
jgi:signal transduction histidine kinase/CheY-like chemotaxis protein/HPt (histidine-containing phosphotransfer) domain-containing protein